MKIKAPVSVRLTVWYSFLLFMALFLFGGVSFLSISKNLYDEQYNMLSEDTEEISEFIRFENDSLNVRHLIKETEELNLKENGIFFEIWSDSPAPIYRSLNFPRFLNTGFQMPGEGDIRHLKDSQGSVFHLFTGTVRLQKPSGKGTQDYRIRVGQSILYVNRIVKRVRNLLLLMAPVVLLLSALSGWYLARRSLQPVADITKTAREISLYHLDKKLPVPEQDDELRQLVQTFNAMIKRIHDGVIKIRQFTADASHELRTPLTVLRGEIEVTLRKPRENQEYISTLESNLKEIYWMEKIVNDLLLLSRADAGELALQKHKSDFCELALECINLYQHQAETKKTTLEFQASDDRMDCNMDADRMRQVLTNVLDNAIKYTPEGGHIQMDLKQEHDELVLTVRDSGLGIPEKDVPFVFDRFYRADPSRSREQHSSGLGLSICKWIVEAHGGNIGIISKEGKGTTVRIVLPLGNIDPDGIGPI